MWNRAFRRLKTYLQHHNAYDHKTWQGDDLLSRVPTHQVT